MLAALTTGFSIKLFVQQIVAFCCDMRVEHQYSAPWTLAGNSIGGLCCLGVAAELKRNPKLRAKIDLLSVVLGPALGGSFFKTIAPEKTSSAFSKNRGCTATLPMSTTS
jgi:hypothetical protein